MLKEDMVVLRMAIHLPMEATPAEATFGQQPAMAGRTEDTKKAGGPKAGRQPATTRRRQAGAASHGCY